MKQAILCIDDEAIILLALKDELKQRFGDRYIYETAMNTDQAFEIIEELIADGVEVVLILSDWLMPYVKGDEFLIQVYQRYPNIRAIMITGQADSCSIERARREANLYECITKPWNSDYLGEIIERCLGEDITAAATESPSS